MTFENDVETATFYLLILVANPKHAHQHQHAELLVGGLLEDRQQRAGQTDVAVGVEQVAEVAVEGLRVVLVFTVVQTGEHAVDAFDELVAVPHFGHLVGIGLVVTEGVVDLGGSGVAGIESVVSLHDESAGHQGGDFRTFVQYLQVGGVEEVRDVAKGDVTLETEFHDYGQQGYLCGGEVEPTAEIAHGDFDKVKVFLAKR